MSGRARGRVARGLAVAGVALLLVGGLYLLLIAILVAAEGRGLWAVRVQVLLPAIGVALLGTALPLAGSGSRRATVVTVGLALTAFAAWAALVLVWSLNSR